jgi:hypothetical protein
MLRARSTAWMAATLVLALPAGASALSFGPPNLLPHGDPKASDYRPGGEPSMEFDPSGDGHLYVTAPQSVPAALGSSGVGVSTWASSDFGATWPVSVLTGAANGGGDSDVEVLQDHTVLVADLEAAATDICTSKDFGKTYPDCNGGIATNQQGPENDREWLTRGEKQGVVYLTYHDFAGGFPIIERSDDGGQSFTPCGTIIDPSGPAASNYTPSGGTLVSKPVVAPDGTIYVEFATPDSTAAPVGASLDHMYLATAKGGCNGGTVFTNTVIYENPDANVANIFQAFGRDAGGDLYVLFGGNLTKADADRTNLYLFTSSDNGKTWKHAQVNPDSLGANVLPAVAGGQAKGEAVLGWFGSASKDPNDTKAQWKYYSATTYDGGQTFAETTVTPNVIHYGDICTQGVFCGLIPGQPGDRDLADFSSAAVNPKTGCTALAIPGDPYNRPDLPNGDDNFNSSAYVALQQDQGDCLTAANAGRSAVTASPGGTSTAGGGSTSTTIGSGTCVDRVAPVSHVTKIRRFGKGLRATGTSRDRGCGARGLGTVKRVRVAVAREMGHKKCRFLLASGRFRKTEPCAHGHYLKAKGGAHWSFTVRHRLPKGRYLVRVRAVDAVGNNERGNPRNVKFTRIR